MKLTVFNNDELISEYEVEDSSSKNLDNVVYIGRSDECHLIIDDKQISRQHLKIVKNSNGWEFEKASDLAQIMHNGSLSGKGKLKNGDVLSFSGYLVNFFQGAAQSSQVQAASVQPEPEIQEEPIVTKTKVTPEKTATTPTPLPAEKTKAKTASIKAAIENDDLGEATPVETTDFAAPEETFQEAKTDSMNSFEEHIGGESTEEAANDDFLNETPPAEENNFSEGETTASTDNNQTSEENFSNQATESNYPVANEGDTAGGEEGGGDRDDAGTVVFNAFATYELTLFGESAPYDRFVLTDNETFIGRNKERCQIVLDDQEVSGVHAVIKKTKISCTLEDLNSSNGTLVNGERINKIELTNNDEFVIGGTTFTVHVKSDLLQAENDRLMPVEEHQEVTKEEIVEEEVEFKEGEEGLDFSDAAAAPASQSIFKDPKKKKILIYAVVGLLGAWLLFGEEEKPEGDPKAAGTKQAKEKSNLLNPNATPDPNDKTKGEVAKKKTFSKEEEAAYESSYQLAKEYVSRGNYLEASTAIAKVNPEYKNARQISELAAQGLKRLEELKKKAAEEEERKKRKIEVELILEKAKEAVKNREQTIAEALFSQILEKDPENLDVPQLKMELEAWKKEQERIALEKAQKEAERKRQVSLLNPGKTAFIAKDWARAIGKLDEFLKQKDMDEDLIKEAAAMLAESRTSLSDLVAPLLGQARSLKEGQDLKGAYQIYSEVLNKEPSNKEAITEMNEIRGILEEKAKKLYREAIISESLSLFDEAKEKFQEVQQTTPTDSDYYKKASEKLKNYME